MRSISYRALFNGDENEAVMEMEGLSALFQNTLLLFLFAVIIIAAFGYLMYQVHHLNLKDVAIFGLLFTIIQLLLINTFSMKLGFDNIYNQNTALIGFEMFSTLIFAFIISFGSFYGGGYLRKVLNK